MDQTVKCMASVPAGRAEASMVLSPGDTAWDDTVPLDRAGQLL